MSRNLVIILTAHCSAFGGDFAAPCCTTARWLKFHHSLQFATLRLTELQLLIFQLPVEFLCHNYVLSRLHNLAARTVK